MNRSVAFFLAFSLTNILGVVHAFAPANPKQSGAYSVSKNTRDSSSKLHIATEIVAEMSAARGAFWMCFFGASGVGSIGRELIPIVFGRYQANRNTETEAVDNNGKELDLSTATDMGIWGYPNKIYQEDVVKILNNPLNAEAIVQKFPVEREAVYEYSHTTNPVFLTYEAFGKANPKANPVALRAAFDSFSNSIGGSNAISPFVAQEKIDLYKGDVGAMTKKLNNGKLSGIAAFVLVLCLLGLADGLALYHVWKGWFPEWQGFTNMPASLFNSDIGILTIPEYFVLDVPEH